MADNQPGTPSAPVTHHTPTRPGQPGADESKRRTDPNPHSGPAEPPYPSYEKETRHEVDSVERDSDRPSTTER